MSISCGCDFGGDYDFYYNPPTDYIKMPVGRRKRCCSCNTLIGIRDTATRFLRYRDPVSDIEQQICGDEVWLADNFMCEECSDIFFSLTAMGICITLNDSMQNDLAEYLALKASGDI